MKHKTEKAQATAQDAMMNIDLTIQTRTSNSAR